MVLQIRFDSDSYMYFSESTLYDRITAIEARVAVLEAKNGMTVTSTVPIQNETEISTGDITI